MPARLCIAVCDFFRREMETVLASGDFSDVSSEIFPAHCRSPVCTADVVAQMELRQPDCDRVLVIGSACLAGARPVVDAAVQPRTRVLCLGQCFYPFMDAGSVDGLVASGSYLVTPGWLRTWRQRLEQWGLDQATARDLFAETTQALVLLDTGVDNDSAAEFESFAAYLDRPARRVEVGLGFFRTFVRAKVLEWRLERAQAKATDKHSQVQRQVADYALALDLMGALARHLDETMVVGAILDLFQMLCAPQVIYYVEVADQGHVELWQAQPPRHPEPDAVALARLWPAVPADGLWGQHGLVVSIRYQDRLVGVLALDQFAFPEYHSHYRNVAMMVAPICGLAVNNARTFWKVATAEEALRQANAELARRARTDDLTQVANRRSFNESLALEWRRAARNSTPIAVVMIDIDHFKPFNDTYGHLAGDSCLTCVAHAIGAQLSRAGDLLARYGGEEFVVLLPSTPLDGAVRVAERVRRAVEDLAIPHLAAAALGRVTLSLGVAAQVAVGQMSPEALVALADAALYRAKREGRNRVAVATASLDPLTSGEG